MVARARVVGIDAAGKYGWVGVLIDANGFVGARTGSIEEIVQWAEPVDVVGVDIPIGHVDGGVRRCDVEARAFVGHRRSSVFAAPPLDALRAASYAEANAALAASGMPMMSRQAWALVPKILEAEVAATADERIYEVHPEVSFCTLAGAPLRWSKKSWNGLLMRRRLLADVGIVLPDVLADVAAVADDVVDAAVVAWSAARIAAGEACTFPDPPEVSSGRPVAIWY